MFTSIHTNAQYNTVEIQHVHWPCIVDGKYVDLWWRTIPNFPPACLFWFASARNLQNIVLTKKFNRLMFESQLTPYCIQIEAIPPNWLAHIVCFFFRLLLKWPWFCRYDHDWASIEDYREDTYKTAKNCSYFHWKWKRK